MKTLLAHTKEINEQLARYGVKFGIYKDGTFNERLFPFDPVPRQIPEKAYAVLEKGLIQRVTALNRFIYDIYHDKKIVKTEWFRKSSYTVPRDIWPSARALRRQKMCTAIFPASTW